MKILILVILIVLSVYLYLSNITYYKGSQSDHFDGKEFFNPYEEKTSQPVLSFLKWRLTRQSPDRIDYSQITQQFDNPPLKYENKGIRVSFVGHASVLVQVEGVNILIDPVWSERVSPFKSLGPKRINEPGIKFENLPPIDLVLISHNHYDHLDIETLLKLKKAHNSVFITPLGNDAILKNYDKTFNVKAFDWYDEYSFNNIKIHVVPAVHWSGRFMLDRNKALWGGFIIETSLGNVYFSGDTALGSGKIFDDISKKFGKPLFAILPIGAYEPRWFMKNNHFNPEDAFVVHQKLGAPYALGVHHGTFHLSDETAQQQEEDFFNAEKKFNVDKNIFRMLKVGEAWEIKADNK